MEAALLIEVLSMIFPTLPLVLYRKEDQARRIRIELTFFLVGKFAELGLRLWMSICGLDVNLHAVVGLSLPCRPCCLDGCQRIGADC
jgi:hypothetical protein